MQDGNASSEDVAAAIAAMHAEGMLESPQDFTFALKSLGRKRLCRLEAAERLAESLRP